MVVVAVAVIGTILGSLAVSSLNSKQNGEDTRVFKGAFAEYRRFTSVMGYSCSFSVKLHVLDLNSTHAYLSTYFSMGSNLGETVEDENSTWVEFQRLNS